MDCPAWLARRGFCLFDGFRINAFLNRNVKENDFIISKCIARRGLPGAAFMKLFVGCHRFSEIFLPKVRGVGLLLTLIEMKITLCVFVRRGLPGEDFVYLMFSELMSF